MILKTLLKSNTSEKGGATTSPVSSKHKAPVTPLNLNNSHNQEQEKHILNLNMLSSERKGAFAVFSPGTAADVAAVYGDGEGGKVNHSGIASIRHSK